MTEPKHNNKHSVVILRVIISFQLKEELYSAFLKIYFIVKVGTLCVLNTITPIIIEHNNEKDDEHVFFSPGRL